jgi:hypothetical protein
MSLSDTKADLAWIDTLPTLDPEVKRLLRDARVSIESLYLPDEDKEDLGGSIRRFAREVSNPDRHPERLMRYWRRIEELSPTIGHMLAKSEAIQELSLCWGACIQPKGGFLNESSAREFVESVGDPQIRTALEWAYATMWERSLFDGDRPEGAFDLLYFYKVLASLLDSPYIEVKLPSPNSGTD